jgi:hypothetical protein
MKSFAAVIALFVLGASQTWAGAVEETPSEDTPIDWASPESIKEHMVFKLVPVIGEQTFAPNIVSSDPTLAENFSDIYLVRTENLDEGEYFTLYITAQYHDDHFRNYSTAMTSKGEKLNLTKLSQSESDKTTSSPYTYEEKMAVELGFVEIVDSMTTQLELILEGDKPNLSPGNISDNSKRVDHIKIPGNYFLAIMRTLRAE